MDAKKSLAKEILDRATQLLLVIHEPGSTFQIDTVRTTRWQALKQDSHNLKISLANGDSIEISLELKSEGQPAGIPVDTSEAEAENKSGTGGLSCVICGKDLSSHSKIDPGQFPAHIECARNQ
jgi:hypothetical protein